jgi:hypothetical protein
MGGSPVRPRNAVVGEHFADVTQSFGATTRRAELIRKERSYGYHLGTIEAARAAFTDAVRMTITWDEL